MRECYTCKKNWDHCRCEDSGYKDVDLNFQGFHYQSNRYTGVADLWAINEIPEAKKVEKKMNFVEQLKGFF